MKKANECNVCDPCGICEDDALCLCQFEYKSMEFLFDEDIAKGRVPLISKRCNGDVIYEQPELKETSNL